MEHIDLIILVIANTGTDYYCGFINEYWSYFINYIDSNNYNIKVFLLFGNGYNVKQIDINEKNIILSEGTHEDWIPGILHKTIFGLEYIHNTYTYKHILRTNLSSFFILDNLVKTNKMLPEFNIYAGICAPDFVSGAAYWLSKDIVEYILHNKSELNFNAWDDVAIGKLLEHFLKTQLNRYDIPENSDMENIVSTCKDHYHIRVKSSNRNKDVITMKKLFQLFY